MADGRLLFLFCVRLCEAACFSETTPLSKRLAFFYTAIKISNNNVLGLLPNYCGVSAKMSEKVKSASDGPPNLQIPKALLKRVETYCQSVGIAPREFIIDAVSEKLASIHKERRRKPRL